MAIRTTSCCYEKLKFFVVFVLSTHAHAHTHSRNWYYWAQEIIDGGMASQQKNVLCEPNNIVHLLLQLHKSFIFLFLFFCFFVSLTTIYFQIKLLNKTLTIFVFCECMPKQHFSIYVSIMVPCNHRCETLMVLKCICFIFPRAGSRPVIVGPKTMISWHRNTLTTAGCQRDFSTFM